MIPIRRRSLKIIYVSSYIPRKCGIATFTKDLTNAINMLNPFDLAEIMALNRQDDNLDYPWEVKYKINWNDLNSYLEAATYINQSGADLVMLEHEFGIFGGQGGEYIVPFVEKITKPLVVTCHTVPDDQNCEGGIILKRVLARADALVVMMHQVADKLMEKYLVPRNKIAIIPHGTPDLAYGAVSRYKKNFKKRVLFGNINLISPSRGIEYSIEATAEIVKKIPNILLLVVGQTHPGEIEWSGGEVYRNKLTKLVKELKITKNVKFINRYVTLEELIEWLKLMDFYVTPYLDPGQVSSGALAYAIGAGKLCISTPYLYAKEVLDNERGVIVPFRNSKAIAKAVTRFNDDFELKEKTQKKAYDYGRYMTWPNVALQHLDLFQKVLKMKKGKSVKN